MTMEIGLIGLFGGLGLWFEATVGYRFVASYLTHGHNVRTCPTNIHYVYAIVSFLPSRSSLRSSHQLRKLLVERSLYLPAQLIGPSGYIHYGLPNFHVLNMPTVEPVSKSHGGNNTSRQANKRNQPERKRKKKTYYPNPVSVRSNKINNHAFLVLSHACHDPPLRERGRAWDGAVSEGVRYGGHPHLRYSSESKDRMAPEAWLRVHDLRRVDGGRTRSEGCFGLAVWS